MGGKGEGKKRIGGSAHAIIAGKEKLPKVSLERQRWHARFSNVGRYITQVVPVFY